MATLDKQRLFRHVRYQPHEGQLEVHLSGARRRVLACGVRWGKTTCAVHEALAAVLAPTGPSRGWIVSPTFDTSDLAMNEVFRLLQARFGHRVLELDARRRRAVVTNLAGAEAQVSAKSATRKETLLGDSLDWVIVDEAARLAPGVWREHISQRLVDRDGWALLASTPKEADDWFHEEFRRAAGGDAGFAAWTRPTWENPAVEKAVVDAEKARLTEEVFHTQYGGEFIGPGGRICPRCGWGGHDLSHFLSEENWLRCTTCPECGRPIDEHGKPVGQMTEDGVVYVSTYREAGGEADTIGHRDPALREALLAGGIEPAGA